MISTVFLLYSYEYVNDDNANANEGNAKDDDVAHVLDDDDDDVVVSDDDEVNP
ncbi:hypothetical protein Tco_0539254, partial [Tanacetum coccineum]